MSHSGAHQTNYFTAGERIQCAGCRPTRQKRSAVVLGVVPPDSVVTTRIVKSNEDGRPGTTVVRCSSCGTHTEIESTTTAEGGKRTRAA